LDASGVKSRRSSPTRFSEQSTSDLVCAMRMDSRIMTGVSKSSEIWKARCANSCASALSAGSSIGTRAKAA